jgi:hypothetical protein
MISSGALAQRPKIAGIDMDIVMRDLATNRNAIDALLGRNHAQAVAFGFQGTPAFIIGHFRIPGALDAAAFKQAIADARGPTAQMIVVWRRKGAQFIPLTVHILGTCTSSDVARWHIPFEAPSCRNQPSV